MAAAHPCRRQVCGALCVQTPRRRGSSSLCLRHKRLRAYAATAYLYAVAAYLYAVTAYLYAVTGGGRGTSTAPITISSSPTMLAQCNGSRSTRKIHNGDSSGENSAS